MFLVVRLIDMDQKPLPNGDHMEYDIVVNPANVWYIRPNQNRDTCTIVYKNNAQHVVRHTVSGLHDMINQNANKSGEFYVKPPVVKEESQEEPVKKGPFGRPVSKPGTTSAALA